MDISQHNMESGDMIDAHLEQVCTGVKLLAIRFLILPPVSPKARRMALTPERHSPSCPSLSTFFSFICMIYSDNEIIGTAHLTTGRSHHQSYQMNSAFTYGENLQGPSNSIGDLSNPSDLSQSERIYQALPLLFDPPLHLRGLRQIIPGLRYIPPIPVRKIAQ